MSFCYYSPYSPTGLYVNLVTFQGFGQEHVQSDVARSGGRLYLHLQYEQIPKAQPDASAAGEAVPKHLGINVEGGFIVGSHYDTVKKRALAVWMPATATFMKFPLPCPRIPEFVSNICDAVASHGGMRSQQQVEAWEGEQVFESKYARGLVQLNNGKRISNDPKTWRCEASGDTHNLWLNLSTGYIGGGRRNWDGSGGSGAALQHYIDTGRQFPLCVKLGTITPQGADVWSYAEDEDSMVIDPLLPEHLRHWGIDVVGLEKTEKSTNEIEAELNAKYDWSKIIVEGDTARLAFGPGYVGLRNIGSSCYMNSILQAMFSVPEVTLMMR
jgi:ubiquitin carboxyl-terminal hydrolase 5/13